MTHHDGKSKCVLISVSLPSAGDRSPNCLIHNRLQAKKHELKGAKEDMSRALSQLSRCEVAYVVIPSQP